MPLPFAAGVTVTILTQDVTGTDRYSNAVYGTTAETDYVGCAVAPSTRDEDHDNARDAVSTHLNAYLPEGAVVTALDLARIDGVVYRIEGEPAVWTSPYTGVTRGVVISLLRVEG